MIRDVLGLAVGTLNRIPVPAPRRVDRRVAGTAMSLAPLVGVMLGAMAAVLVAALVALVDVKQRSVPVGVADYTPVSILTVADAAVEPLPALLIAVLAVAFGAWVTRGLHLDGLADLADALGSRKPAAQALDIAKRSDIGPFGVMTVTFILLVQVAALAMLVGRGLGPVGIVIAMTAGRIAVPVATRRGVPAARPDGLGAMVAGTVPRLVPLAWAVVVAVGAFVLLRPVLLPSSVTFAMGGTSFVDAFAAAWRRPLLTWPPAGALSVVLAALVAVWVVRVARKRLGGMTGDAIGAATEAATTVCLLTLALLA